MEMTKKLSQKLSQRQIASITLSNLYAISDVLDRHGELLNPEKWLFCLAHALGSAEPGVIPVPARHQRKPARWFGLEFETLKRAANRCWLETSDNQIAEVLHRVSSWRKNRRVGVRLRPDTYARILGVTAEVRREAKATLVGAIDETPGDRRDRRRIIDRDRKTQQRREAGMRPQSESLSQRRPWIAEGISRSTWYRRNKATPVLGDTVLSATS